MKKTVRILMVMLMTATAFQGKVLAEDGDGDGGNTAPPVNINLDNVPDTTEIALAVAAVGTVTWLVIRHHKKKKARMAAATMEPNQVLASAQTKPPTRSKKKRGFFARLSFGFTAAGQSIGRASGGGNSGGSQCIQY